MCRVMPLQRTFSLMHRTCALLSQEVITYVFTGSESCCLALIECFRFVFGVDVITSGSCSLNKLSPNSFKS